MSFPLVFDSGFFHRNGFSRNGFFFDGFILYRNGGGGGFENVDGAIGIISHADRLPRLLLDVQNQRSCKCSVQMTCAELSGLAYAMKGYSDKHTPLSTQELIDYLRRPDFEYNSKGHEVNLNEVKDYLVTYGVCKAKHYPFVRKMNTYQDRTEVNHFTKYKIRDIECIPNLKVCELKIIRALNKTPLIASLNSDRLRDLKIGEVYDCYGKPDHAVIVTGHALLNGNICIEFKNSWGENWCNGGYGLANIDVFDSFNEIVGVYKDKPQP